MLRYLDLATKLREPPLNYRRTEEWNSRIPPTLYGDALTICALRTTLLPLLGLYCHQNEGRATEHRRPTPAPHSRAHAAQALLC